jgi:cytochrome c oxidase subunit 2
MASGVLPMKSQRVIVGTFVLVLLPLLWAARPSSLAAQAQTPPAIREIELKATKYEFAPNKIELVLNTPVRFKITAADNEHGFEIEGAVETTKTKIPKGETKTVEYKPTKAGTFKFKCNHFCGMGHSKMNGEITVK